MTTALISDYLLSKLEYPSDLADTSAIEPLNLQLYRLMREAIVDGTFQPQLKLISSRALARDLGLSRNTVMYAYEQLFSEGYLETRHGSGTFVAKDLPDPKKAFERISAPPVMKMTADADYSLSSRGKTLVTGAHGDYAAWGAFRTGVPDVTEFPKKIWMRFQNKVWYRSNTDLLTYAPRGGYFPLRKAIAEYLRISRAVHCSAEQVIITSGTHQSFDLVIKLLGAKGDTVWLEDPAYWGLRRILSAFDLKQVPIPVDDEGIKIPQTWDAPPRFIFVTPSHQYPLGMVMSLERRKELLSHAFEHRSWIIEDDYDSEFRYIEQPLAALQGLDSNGIVLYMGTFSKTLFPALKIGFLVVPASLAEEFSTALSVLYRGGQVLNQAVLTEFIESGNFGSHIRRMRIIYMERLKELRACIHEHFGNEAHIIDGEAGLHLTLGLPRHCDDRVICNQAAAAGIMSRPLSSYFTDPENVVQGLLLGYSSVSTEQIRPAFNRLAGIIKSHIHSGSTC